MEPDSDEDTSSKFEMMQVEPEDSTFHQSHQESEESEYKFRAISADIGDEFEINAIHGESNLPQNGILLWKSVTFLKPNSFPTNLRQV
jgi:hypothetical protein